MDYDSFVLTLAFSILATSGYTYLDSKAHGANMGPTWVLAAPDGPHVYPMNLAIRVVIVVRWSAPIDNMRRHQRIFFINHAEFWRFPWC